MTDAGRLTIAMPTDREVVITRVFDAPRDLVFDALTKPELVRRWLEAPGRPLVVCEIDLQVGGAYRYVFRGAGKTDIGVRGVYREIVPPERIVTTESWEDWDAGETLATTVLVEQSGTTTFTSTVLFPSREVRDSVVKAGLERASAENYEKLAQLLAYEQRAAS